MDEQEASLRYAGVTVRLNPRLCIEIKKDTAAGILHIHTAMQYYRVPLFCVRKWQMMPPHLVMDWTVVWMLHPDSLITEHQFYGPPHTPLRYHTNQPTFWLSYFDVSQIISDAGEILWEKLSRPRARIVLP